MQVLIDKVAERMAYERGGTRLYDAALVKVIALADATPVNVGRVKQIRNQEAEHAELLRQALIKLGADPTAQTPCADLVGIQSMGLIQSVTDPRTSLVQKLSLRGGIGAIADIMLLHSNATTELIADACGDRQALLSKLVSLFDRHRPNALRFRLRVKALLFESRDNRERLVGPFE